MSIKGKVLVFTGTLTRTRKVATKEATSKGAFVRATISRNTDIVVCGENAGSKREKAEDLGVTIWEEEDFDAALAAADDSSSSLSSSKQHKAREEVSRSRSREKKAKRLKRKSKAKPKMCLVDKKTKCWYAADCYDKSKEHWRQYWHPSNSKNRPKGILDIYSSASEAEDDENEALEKAELKEDTVEPEQALDDEELLKVMEQSADESSAREALEGDWKAKLVEQYLEGGTAKSPEKLVKKVKGKTCVLTGWFPVDRKHLVHLLRNAGVKKLCKDVGDATELLIVGQRPGVSLFEAHAYGVPVLMLDELYSML